MIEIVAIFAIHFGVNRFIVLYRGAPHQSFNVITLRYFHLLHFENISVLSAFVWEKILYYLIMVLAGRIITSFGSAFVPPSATPEFQNVDLLYNVINEYNVVGIFYFVNL